MKLNILSKCILFINDFIKEFDINFQSKFEKSNTNIKLDLSFTKFYYNLNDIILFKKTIEFIDSSISSHLTIEDIIFNYNKKLKFNKKEYNSNSNNTINEHFNELSLLNKNIDNSIETKFFIKISLLLICYYSIFEKKINLFINYADILIKCIIEYFETDSDIIDYIFFFEFLIYMSLLVDNKIEFDINLKIISYNNLSFIKNKAIFNKGIFYINSIMHKIVMHFISNNINIEYNNLNCLNLYLNYTIEYLTNISYYNIYYLSTNKTFIMFCEYIFKINIILKRNNFVNYEYNTDIKTIDIFSNNYIFVNNDLNNTNFIYNKIILSSLDYILKSSNILEVVIKDILNSSINHKGIIFINSLTKNYKYNYNKQTFYSDQSILNILKINSNSDNELRSKIINIIFIKFYDLILSFVFTCSIYTNILKIINNHKTLLHLSKILKSNQIYNSDNVNLQSLNNNKQLLRNSFIFYNKSYIIYKTVNSIPKNGFCLKFSFNSNNTSPNYPLISFISKCKDNDYNETNRYSNKSVFYKLSTWFNQKHNTAFNKSSDTNLTAVTNFIDLSYDNTKNLITMILLNVCVINNRIKLSIGNKSFISNNEIKKNVNYSIIICQTPPNQFNQTEAKTSLIINENYNEFEQFNITSLSIFYNMKVNNISSINSFEVIIGRGKVLNTERQGTKNNNSSINNNIKKSNIIDKNLEYISSDNKINIKVNTSKLGLLNYSNNDHTFNNVNYTNNKNLDKIDDNNNNLLCYFDGFISDIFLVDSLLECDKLKLLNEEYLLCYFYEYPMNIIPFNLTNINHLSILEDDLEYNTSLNAKDIETIINNIIFIISPTINDSNLDIIYNKQNLRKVYLTQNRSIINIANYCKFNDVEKNYYELNKVFPVYNKEDYINLFIFENAGLNIINKISNLNKICTNILENLENLINIDSIKITSISYFKNLLNYSMINFFKSCMSNYAPNIYKVYYQNNINKYFNFHNNYLLNNYKSVKHFVLAIYNNLKKNIAENVKYFKFDEISLNLYIDVLLYMSNDSIYDYSTNHKTIINSSCNMPELVVNLCVSLFDFNNFYYKDIKLKSKYIEYSKYFIDKYSDLLILDRQYPKTVIKYLNSICIDDYCKTCQYNKSIVYLAAFENKHDNTDYKYNNFDNNIDIFLLKGLIIDENNNFKNCFCSINKDNNTNEFNLKEIVLYNKSINTLLLKYINMNLVKYKFKKSNENNEFDNFNEALNRSIEYNLFIVFNYLIFDNKYKVHNLIFIILNMLLTNTSTNNSLNNIETLIYIFKYKFNCFLNIIANIVAYINDNLELFKTRSSIALLILNMFINIHNLCMDNKNVFNLNDIKTFNNVNARLSNSCKINKNSLIENNDSSKVNLKKCKSNNNCSTENIIDVKNTKSYYIDFIDIVCNNILNKLSCNNNDYNKLIEFDQCLNYTLLITCLNYLKDQKVIKLIIAYIVNQFSTVFISKIIKEIVDYDIINSKENDTNISTNIINSDLKLYVDNIIPVGNEINRVSFLNFKDQNNLNNNNKINHFSNTFEFINFNNNINSLYINVYQYIQSFINYHKNKSAKYLFIESLEKFFSSNKSKIINNQILQYEKINSIRYDYIINNVSCFSDLNNIIDLSHFKDLQQMENNLISNEYISNRKNKLCLDNYDIMNNNIIIEFIYKPLFLAFYYNKLKNYIKFITNDNLKTKENNIVSIYYNNFNTNVVNHKERLNNELVNISFLDNLNNKEIEIKKIESAIFNLNKMLIHYLKSKSLNSNIINSQQVLTKDYIRSYIINNNDNLFNFFINNYNYNIDYTNVLYPQLDLEEFNKLINSNKTINKPNKDLNKNHLDKSSKYNLNDINKYLYKLDFINTSILSDTFYNHYKSHIDLLKYIDDLNSLEEFLNSLHNIDKIYFSCYCELITIEGVYFGVIELTYSKLIFRKLKYNKDFSNNINFFLRSQLNDYLFDENQCNSFLQENIRSIIEIDLFFVSEIILRKFLHMNQSFEVFDIKNNSYLFNLFSSEVNFMLLNYLNIINKNSKLLYKCYSIFDRLKTEQDKTFDKVYYKFKKIIKYMPSTKIKPYSYLIIKDSKLYFNLLCCYTELWKENIISNYNYILMLNKYSNRSYNDLNQYPTFPWIYTDYKSDKIDLKNKDNFRKFNYPIGCQSTSNIENSVIKFENDAENMGINEDYFKTIGLNSNVYIMRNSIKHKVDKSINSVKDNYYNNYLNFFNLSNSLIKANDNNSNNNINKGLYSNLSLSSSLSKNSRCSLIANNLTLYEANNIIDLIKKHFKLESINLNNNDTNNIDDIIKFPIHHRKHYSTSSYVIYYMIRVPPFTKKLIKFHGHKFDNPDRLFNSIEETFSTLNMNNDNRELIPEFFNFPEMFVNNNSFYFGYKNNKYNNKTLINDVILPKWSINPVDFVFKHRILLESYYTNCNIHKWINNIFGYSQLIKINDKNSFNLCKDTVNMYPSYSYINGINLKDVYDLVYNDIAIQENLLKEENNKFKEFIHNSFNNNKLFLYDSCKIQLYKRILVFKIVEYIRQLADNMLNFGICPIPIFDNYHCRKNTENNDLYLGIFDLITLTKDVVYPIKNCKNVFSIKSLNYNIYNSLTNQYNKNINLDSKKNNNLVNILYYQKNFQDVNIINNNYDNLSYLLYQNNNFDKNSNMYISTNNYKYFKFLCYGDYYLKTKQRKIIDDIKDTINLQQNNNSNLLNYKLLKYNYIISFVSINKIYVLCAFDDKNFFSKFTKSYKSIYTETTVYNLPDNSTNQNKNNILSKYTYDVIYPNEHNIYKIVNNSNEFYDKFSKNISNFISFLENYKFIITVNNILTNCNSIRIYKNNCNYIDNNEIHREYVLNYKLNCVTTDFLSQVLYVGCDNGDIQAFQIIISIEVLEKSKYPVFELNYLHKVSLDSSINILKYNVNNNIILVGFKYKACIAVINSKTLDIINLFNIDYMHISKCKTIEDITINFSYNSNINKNVDEDISYVKQYFTIIDIELSSINLLYSEIMKCNSSTSYLVGCTLNGYIFDLLKIDFSCYLITNKGYLIVSRNNTLEVLNPSYFSEKLLKINYINVISHFSLSFDENTIFLVSYDKNNNVLIEKKPFDLDINKIVKFMQKK